MNYREPPNINPEKLDFSQFHDLFHHVWDKECKQQYGGRRRHLYMLWNYKWDVPSQFRRFTVCLVGHHKPGQVWIHPRDPQRRATFQACVWCHKRLSKNQPA